MKGPFDLSVDEERKATDFYHNLLSSIWYGTFSKLAADAGKRRESLENRCWELPFDTKLILTVYGLEMRGYTSRGSSEE